MSVPEVEFEGTATVWLTGVGRSGPDICTCSVAISDAACAYAVESPKIHSWTHAATLWAGDWLFASCWSKTNERLTGTISPDEFCSGAQPENIAAVSSAMMTTESLNPESLKLFARCRILCPCV
jgi:hypothetical protein